MTNTSTVSTVVYGMRELRRLYKRYVTLGLIISTSAHLLIISSYYIAEFFKEDEDAIPMVRIMKYSELGPPPSITNTETAPAVAVTVPVAKPTVGVPVPVPDAEVSPEQTIATQQELSAVQTPIITDGNLPGISIEQDIQIEDDPDPSAFIPVEKQPVPVKQVQPEYPEIARRAGVEGTVWVKILVDKDGKAKKAIIMKSDAEVFNEPALQAALQFVFTPAMMNNGPVAVWAAVPFRFRLSK